MTQEKIRERYRLTRDLHTHTVYSRVFVYRHAVGSIMENVRAAHEAGLSELAITDHGPGEIYGIDLRKIPKMREEIAEAQVAYPDVRVLLGVEANIVDTPNGLDIAPEDADKFDFINAGYHFGARHCRMIRNRLYSKGLMTKRGTEELRRYNTEIAVRALRNNNIRILTHPGDKAPFDLDVLGKTCEETGTIMEINARHRHPSAEELRLLARYDVDFIIGSDAHNPTQVGRYTASLARALEAGIPVSRIINVEER